MLDLGLSHLAGLLHIVDPRAPTPVLAPLLEADVPHRPADAAVLLGRLSLLRRELEPVSPADQHASPS
jgi:hypothetical protein